jgi:hypothetical protein
LVTVVAVVAVVVGTASAPPGAVSAADLLVPGAAFFCERMKDKLDRFCRVQLAAVDRSVPRSGPKTEQSNGGL